MKTNFKNLFRRMTTIVIVFLMVFSFTATGYAAQNDWNNGKKVNYVSSSSNSSYKASEWTKNLVDLYQLKWYESPTREVLKGEFMLVQLRTIQSSLKSRGLELLSAPKETLNYKDNKTLTASAQEEAKILKSLGILSGNSDGYMKINVPIKRSEAAKVLAVANCKVLKIPSIRTAKGFVDTKGHWSEKYVSIAYQTALLNGLSSTKFSPEDSLTLEQTLQILENEVGYFGITRADVAKAMNETFKVTLDTTKSNSLVTKNSYVKYEEKMKTYGFDQLYDNKSSKTSESVTKSEAIKLALAVIFNVDDAHDFGPLLNGFGEENNEYANANWVDYARSQKLLKYDVNSTNYNDKVNYIEVISLFESCKMKFLEDYLIKDTKVYLKDISNYSLDEQSAIKDMLSNGIIYPISDTLNGSDYIFKGQLNELVVNFAEKYNTIALDGDKINTDPAKMPSNASDFAYILSNVDLKMYEKMPLNKTDWNAAPQKIYALKKELYPNLKTYMEQSFNSMLNVDYRTITEENFMQDVREYFIFGIDPLDVKYYVEYVKANQIIIEGTSKLQAPIIYFDGSLYRARIKLNFEVKHSNTKDNLLFLDIVNSVKKTYEKEKYDLVSDYRLGINYGNPELYLSFSDLYKTLLDKSKSGIVEEDY
jgi:hypothetical protein